MGAICSSFITVRARFGPIAGSDASMSETRILPAIAGRRVADIHGGDVKALHRAISASGSPVRANRVLALLSTMFSLALQPRAGEAKPWRDAALMKELCC